MSNTGKTQTKYRVCKTVTTNSIGGVPTYELVSIEYPDFEDLDKARMWIDDLDDNHRYSEYVILEVLRRV
jgi:hypothetical protein